MSTMVVELYEALRQAGVAEAVATAAARAVWLPEQPASKADLEILRREMAELKVDIIKWNVGAMAVLTAIFAAIVKLGS